MNQAHANTATLAVAGVSKTLGGVQLFKDVNLQLQQGESLAVVGESGSGKSTLARQVMALETPTSGSVELFGQDLPEDQATAFVADKEAVYRELFAPVFSEVAGFKAFLAQAQARGRSGCARACRPRRSTTSCRPGLR